MAKSVKKTRKKIGAAPGTLIHIGEKYHEESGITLIQYGKEEFSKKQVKEIEDCFKDKELAQVKWINVDGLQDISIIEKIGEAFHLHPLLLEDVLNTGQRPKLDEYDQYLFIVLKMLYYDIKENEMKAEQVSFILVSNYIISFQEFTGDVFDGVRERIEAGKGNIKKQGADYLLYALIDAIVDSYFEILEKIGDKTDEIEEELMNDPGKEVLQMIYRLKRNMLFLRNSIWPLREVVSLLLRSESTLFKESTQIYVRDVYDHIIQVIDTIETYRDMISGMLDTYLSSISNRMNEIMKVLTIFSTIFIPITFIAGIYGMNFKYMPELEWSWGYGMFWGIILLVIALMLRYFRKKRWI